MRNKSEIYINFYICTCYKKQLSDTIKVPEIFKSFTYICYSKLYFDPALC